MSAPAILFLLVAILVAACGGVVYHWVNMREAERAYVEALRIKPTPPKDAP